jgi:hypothetical protein
MITLQSRSCKWLGWMAWLPACAWLCGCGLTANQKNTLQQFGFATEQFAALTRAEVIQSRRDVIEMNRMRLVLGTAGEEPLDNLLDLASARARLDALDALSRYAELLQLLLTASSPAERQASVDHFITSLNRVPGAAMNSADAETLGKWIVTVGGMWVEHRRARAVRGVVELAHPHVVRVVELVRRDFDPNADFWNAAYRRTRLNLERAIREATQETKDSAGTRWIRSTRLSAREFQLRFDQVSEEITQTADELRQAEEQLFLAMTDERLDLAEVDAYRSQVNELRALVELLGSR